MLKLTYLLSSIALFALPMTAHAQEAPQPDDAAAANDEIVVTGTAGGGINRQDAAFAITSINSDAIERAAPNSTADLFKVIPGVSRSEEHTSELQSLMRISYAVFCLKKKKTTTHIIQ